MGFHLLISTHFTRVDGTIRPYRYFSNHDDKVVTLGPREVEFGTAKQPGDGPQFRVGTVTVGLPLKILTVENKNSHGDSACRGMSPKRPSKQQQQLNVDQFKLWREHHHICLLSFRGEEYPRDGYIAVGSFLFL